MAASQQQKPAVTDYVTSPSSALAPCQLWDYARKQRKVHDPVSAATMVPQAALAKLRRQLRMPLHQVISYAELMVEDCEGDRACDLYTSLAGIISACETSLRIISSPAETDDVEQLAKSLQAGLSAPSAQLQDAAAKLRTTLMAGSQAQPAMDVEKLFAAASAFEQMVSNMGANILHGTLSVRDAGLQDASAAAESRGLAVAMQEGTPTRGVVLVVDDDEGNREVLSRRLLRDGCEVMLAESGSQALRMAHRYDFDLVLLDLMMPELDGLAVLTELRRHARLQQLPVIMISAADEVESVIRCIEKGADDYLIKPFNPVLLRARMNALLERKRLQDEEQKKKRQLEQALAEVERERMRVRELLLNVLPEQVAEELQQSGSVQPMYFEDVTIAFADIVDFTRSTEELPAEDLVRMLNDYFTSFDRIIVRYGLEKLKTIGDCYMFSGGLPERNPSHPVDIVLAALEMVEITRQKEADGFTPWKLRIGVHTGPVIAGVVGIQKFAFDIWGEAVNFASRMESNGAPSRVNLSRSTFARVKDFFSCQNRGRVSIKDGSEAEMYFVNGVASGLLAQTDKTAHQSFAARYRTYFRKEMKAFPLSLT